MLKLKSGVCVFLILIVGGWSLALHGAGSGWGVPLVLVVASMVRPGLRLVVRLVVGLVRLARSLDRGGLARRSIVLICARSGLLWPSGQLMIVLYRRLPLNALSRAWGWANDVDLPVWLRGPVLSLYSRAFHCQLDEAEQADPAAYRNLGEFFRRPIKSHLRPIDSKSCLTSPADGRVLHFGRVESGHLEQVKGLSYTLQGFIGPPSWKTDQSERDLDETAYQRALQLRPGNELFHCVVYLAPGDYHRFHSPADWTVKWRRHFPGQLLSVSPSMASWIGGLFALNERAVYVGAWCHGFFSCTAVGATNVGSIAVLCDPELRTNASRVKGKLRLYTDKALPDVVCPKGALFGEFRLGSTLVLIFEAPTGFQFTVDRGDKVKVGQALGSTEVNAEERIQTH